MLFETYDASLMVQADFDSLDGRKAHTGEPVFFAYTKADKSIQLVRMGPVWRPRTSKGKIKKLENMKCE